MMKLAVAVVAALCVLAVSADHENHSQSIRERLARIHRARRTINVSPTNNGFRVTSATVDREAASMSTITFEMSAPSERGLVRPAPFLGVHSTFRNSSQASKSQLRVYMTDLVVYEKGDGEGDISTNRSIVATFSLRGRRRWADITAERLGEQGRRLIITQVPSTAGAAADEPTAVNGVQPPLASLIAEVTPELMVNANNVSRPVLTPNSAKFTLNLTDVQLAAGQAIALRTIIVTRDRTFRRSRRPVVETPNQEARFDTGDDATAAFFSYSTEADVDSTEERESRVGERAARIARVIAGRARRIALAGDNEDGINVNFNAEEVYFSFPDADETTAISWDPAVGVGGVDDDVDVPDDSSDSSGDAAGDSSSASAIKASWAAVVLAMLAALLL